MVMSKNTQEVVSLGRTLRELKSGEIVSMLSICNNVAQTELMRFWVSELTNLAPQQVEAVIETLQEKQASRENELRSSSVKPQAVSTP